jgi:hypothetical protein
MKKLVAAFLGRGKGTETTVAAGRFGPLTEEELLGMAATPLDAGLLRATVHVIRAEGARAARALAGAGQMGLTDSQVREECGALAAAARIEDVLLRLVAAANKRRQ